MYNTNFMKNICIILLISMISCESPIDISFLNKTLKKEVIIEAYSESEVEMIFIVINDTTSFYSYYYLDSGESIKDTLLVNVGNNVIWVDRTHEDSFVLWYKLFQEGYENEASEVYCEDNCKGETTGLKVKV